jgi:rhamnosyltransferase subunit B
VILANAAVMALADLARVGRRDLKVILFYLSPTIIRTCFGKAALGDLLTIPARLPKVFRRMLWSLIDTKFLDVGVVPDLNAARAELGLAKIKHFFPHLQSAADLYVSLFPDWYAPPKPDYPQPLITGHFLLHTPSQYQLSDELREFLDAGQAPILFTPGTGNMHARKFFEVAFDAVQELGARAIFLTKFKDHLPAALPRSILWQRQVPFNELLPRASIVVHHGGIGTLAEASKAGIPQVIVPSAYDQFDNALIVKDLGLGRSIPLRFLTKKRLFTALSQIQRSVDIQANCKTVSLNFGADVQIMEKVVAAL